MVISRISGKFLLFKQSLKIFRQTLRIYMKRIQNDFNWNVFESKALFLGSY